MLRLLDSSEKWKRWFLQPTFTNHLGLSRRSAGSIVRSPSAPPNISTPLGSSTPILPAKGSLLAGECIDRSRSTPPSVRGPTDDWGPHFRPSSDVDLTTEQLSDPVSGTQPGTFSVVSSAVTLPVVPTDDWGPHFRPSSDVDLTTEQLSGPVSGTQPGTFSVDSSAVTLPVVSSSLLDADTSALGSLIPSLVQESHDVASASLSSSQANNIQNFGDHNQAHIGDYNIDNNEGIIVTGGNVQIYGELLKSRLIKLSLTTTAIIYIETTQELLGAVFGIEINCAVAEGEPVGEIFYRLMHAIKSIVEGDNPTIPQVLRDYLRDLWSELCRAAKLYKAEDNLVDIDTLCFHIVSALMLYLFVNHMEGYIPLEIVVKGVKKRMMELQKNTEATAPRKLTKDLPRANAAYDDYVSSHQRRVSCFEGTRQELLQEVGQWVAKSETGVFVLFGLAGTGKSTIAQTVAERADNVRLLGASFFFSRDEAERRTAKRFFTTIAFQLCVHDPEFASAIESVLESEQGKNAISKSPIEQLRVLILEPLQKLNPRNVVIVVDALDECDEEDVPAILEGLDELVQCLSSFKVLLTTRPQFFEVNQISQKVFRLHDIEDKIVDADIELYLRHRLSLKEVKVRLPRLRNPWAASDDEIKSLVRAASGLFIIASTAVLFILDKTSTPADRMKLLLKALERDHTPFKALNTFYTTILRSAVPENCEDDTRDRYQMVIGTIILIEAHLTISELAKFINVEENEITAVLSNLQPVILLGSDDIPLPYHKSFPDYIQDPARCKDEDLRIDPRLHHTRIAKRCLQLLNRRLKQNMLGLGDPARFMDNNRVLEERGLDTKEKITTELAYACSFFGEHMKCAEAEDAKISEDLERFFNEHFLHWLEVLSWIGELDSAHEILLTVQKQLRMAFESSDLSQLVMDGRRFLVKFKELIEESALHTYHSALPLTPTKTRLYQRYTDQMTFCRVLGGQQRWEDFNVFEESDLSGRAIGGVFSPDGVFFACCMEEDEVLALEGKDEQEGDSEGGNVWITIYNVVAGIRLGRIKSRVFAIANGFSKAAIYVDGSITLYNVEGFTPVATIKPSTTVVRLALSHDGSRLVAGLDDATVCLWDTENCEQIKRFDKWIGGESEDAESEKCRSDLAISSDGSRVAFASRDGTVKLLDCTSGKIIANLKFPKLKKPTLMFSGDGSRLGCLSNGSLRVWNSRDGALIRTAQRVGDIMAISPDGSRLVTSDQEEEKLKLFSGNNLAFLKTLDVECSISSLAITNDLIVVVIEDLIVLWDINNLTCIAQFPFENAKYLTFSPDSTCLAVWNNEGEVKLWEVPGVTTSSQRRLPSSFTTLAFSPDCSRLASGYSDGTIKLWDTTNMVEVAPSPHKCHSKRVDALVFGVDGEMFASGSRDRTIMLWDGKDGAARGVLECPGRVWGMNLSSSMLAASTESIITLWDLKTRSVIATLEQGYTTCLVFSHGHSLLAAAHRAKVTLWDTEKHELVNTFQLTSNERRVRRMTFLPDDSQIAVQDDSYNSDDSDDPYNPGDLGDLDSSSDADDDDDDDEGDEDSDKDEDDNDSNKDDSSSSADEGEDEDEFYLFKVHDNDASKSRVSKNQDISRRSLCTSWHGIPVWHSGPFVGQFPRRNEVILFACASSEARIIAEGSSMIALGCKDGRILLIKAI